MIFRKKYSLGKLCDGTQRADREGNKCLSENSYPVEMITVAVTASDISVMKSLSLSGQCDQESITNLCGPEFQLWI